MTHTPEDTYTWMNTWPIEHLNTCIQFALIRKTCIDVPLKDVLHAGSEESVVILTMLTFFRPAFPLSTHNGAFRQVTKLGQVADSGNNPQLISWSLEVFLVPVSA